MGDCLGVQAAFAPQGEGRGPMMPPRALLGWLWDVKRRSRFAMPPEFGHHTGGS